MTVLVNLEADDLRVEPGTSVTGSLTLVNTASIVEQFTVMLLGDVADWTEADPPVVSLFPGGRQTVTLRFSPPRAYTTPSGAVPFGVKIIPSNEPEESVTEEGEITVGSFADVGAELIPRVATARITGHQKVAVDSRGNVPLPVEIAAVDAADALKFSFRPQKMTTAPGEARFIRVRVTPRQRFWRGPQQHKPYQVQVTAEKEKPLVLDGALSQKAVLPKWLLPLLGIAAALVLLWYLVLKPIVHNDAVNASKTALSVQAAQTKALATQVAAASQSAQQANATAAAAAALASRKPATTTTTTTTTIPKAIVKVVPTTTTTSTTVKPRAPGPSVGPIDNRLEVLVAPGNTGTSSWTVPNGDSLDITDVVIQNLSTGQAGVARVQRLPQGSASTPDLLVDNLSTLNDEEFRFSTPIHFASLQQVVLSVDCQASQPACDVGLYYTGSLTKPPAA
jgi:hypothetical protein